MVSRERFAQGMTFDEYVKFMSTPENLKRQGSFNRPRKDYGDYFRKAYDGFRLNEAQQGALTWIAAQPGAPAKVLVISEEWSSDCRRDVPVFARLAATAGCELRIFTRDGERMSTSAAPDSKEQPNADVVTPFLRTRDGQTFQSIPIAAFFTKDFQHLYTYTEFPAIYHKDRVVGAIRAPKPGEGKDQAMERGLNDFFAFQETPIFAMWRSAAADEIISMLHERLRVGSLA
jgi:Thioredoxin